MIIRAKKTNWVELQDQKELFYDFLAFGSQLSETQLGP